MSLEVFIQAHIDNLRGGIQDPYFRDLMTALEISYRSAIAALPAEGVPTTFGRFY
jgi:hypothetical protein